MNDFKIKNKELFLHGNLFDVFKTTVEINGAERIWHDLAINPGVFVIAMNDNQELYLLDQYRHLTNKRAISTVAGFIDEGETALDAAKRELKEEAGLTARKWTELGVFNAASSFMTDSATYFLAEDLIESEQELQDEEDIKIIKLPIKDAVNKSMQKEITNPRSVLGILFLEKYLQTR